MDINVNVNIFSGKSRNLLSSVHATSCLQLTQPRPTMENLRNLDTKIHFPTLRARNRFLMIFTSCLSSDICPPLSCHFCPSRAFVLGRRRRFVAVCPWLWCLVSIYVTSRPRICKVCHRWGRKVSGRLWYHLKVAEGLFAQCTYVLRKDGCVKVM
jgi:hypothetical protein